MKLLSVLVIIAIIGTVSYAVFTRYSHASAVEKDTTVDSPVSDDVNDDSGIDDEVATPDATIHTPPSATATANALDEMEK